MVTKRVPKATFYMKKISTWDILSLKDARPCNSLHGLSQEAYSIPS